MEATGKVSDYRELPQSIVITLLDGPSLLPQSKEWVHVAQLAWDGGAEGIASTRIVLVVVELFKFRSRFNDLNAEVLADEMLAWAYLLTRGYSDPKEVREIVSGFPTIEEFAELYGLAISDPKVVQAHRDAQSAELEHNARMEYIGSLDRKIADAEKRLELIEQAIDQAEERFKAIARAEEQTADISKRSEKEEEA